MKLKRYFAIIVLILILFISIWLVYQVTKPNVLPIGSKLPEIKYFNGVDTCVVSTRTNLKTLVIFFHYQCDYCVYELNVLNNHIEKLGNIKVYLFTTDKEFFLYNYPAEWENLNRDNIIWGIVKPDDFYKNFGSLSTPIFYVFNTVDRLYKINKGEVKIEYLIEIVQL